MKYSAKDKYQNEKYAARYQNARYGGIYGRFKNWSTKRVISKILETAGTKGVALDIPCGTGRLSNLLLENGYKLIGSDISFEMMMESKKRLNGFKGSFWNIRLDAERMPFKNNSIDCIFSIRFIYHIPTEIRYKMLKEMGRVTNKWLIIDYNYQNRFKYTARKIGSLFSKKPIRKRMTLQEISDELKKNGLNISQAIPVSRLFSDNILLLCSKSE